MLELLNQPFPEDNSLVSEIKSSLGVGFFIFLFLFVFKPFGLHSTGDELLKHTIYFGLATTIVSFLFNLFVDYVLKIDRQAESWTFLKWIVSVLVLLLFIAYANYYVLSLIYGEFDISLKVFFKIAYLTFLVGSLPIFFYGASFISKNKKENEERANFFKISAPEDKIGGIKIPTNGNTLLEINADAFLYAEAMQNYIAIYYVEEAQLKKEIIRMPIKQLESYINSAYIFRCHRSYIVNRQNIVSVTGNAQGLKLKLRFTDFELPVSRSYINKFNSD